MVLHTLLRALAIFLGDALVRQREIAPPSLTLVCV